MISMHVYEVRPRKYKRGVDLIADVLPFDDLWYSGTNATDKPYAQSGPSRRTATLGFQLREDRDAGCALPFYGNGPTKFRVFTITRARVPVVL